MEKIYCGNAKSIQTQHGDLQKISMSKDDVNKIVKYMKDNNSDWINIVVKERQTPSQKGMTHYLEVDQWKPNSGVGGNGDLPF